MNGSAFVAPRALVREVQHLGIPTSTSGCSLQNVISWTRLRAVSCALSGRPDSVPSKNT